MGSIIPLYTANNHGFGHCSPRVPENHQFERPLNRGKTKQKLSKKQTSCSTVYFVRSKSGFPGLFVEPQATSLVSHFSAGQSTSGRSCLAHMGVFCGSIEGFRPFSANANIQQINNKHRKKRGGGGGVGKKKKTIPKNKTKQKNDSSTPHLKFQESPPLSIPASSAWSTWSESPNTRHARLPSSTWPWWAVEKIFGWSNLEDHPSGCKLLVTPMYKPWSSPIWKGSHNPILRGRKRSPWLLTTYPNWDDPPRSRLPTLVQNGFGICVEGKNLTLATNPMRNGDFKTPMFLLVEVEKKCNTYCMFCCTKFTKFPTTHVSKDQMKENCVQISTFCQKFNKWPNCSVAYMCLLFFMKQSPNHQKKQLTILWH